MIRNIRFLTVVACFLLTINSFKLLNLKEHRNESISNSQCNITHFEYQTPFSLSYSNTMMEDAVNTLNKTFPALKNITWKVNDSVTYVIYDAVANFDYIRFYQTGKIVQPRIFMIQNGSLKVRLSFKWQKQGVSPKNGSGYASGISEQLAIALQIKTNEAVPTYQLLDYYKLQIFQLTLVRIDPQTTEDEKKDLIKLLNLNGSYVRQQLQNRFDQKYGVILKSYLETDNKRIGQKISYKWNSSTGQFTFNFTRKPLFYHVTSAGIYFAYELQIDGFKGQCGPNLPTIPSDQVESYQAQSFLSKTFEKNLFNFAVQNKVFDTIVGRGLWIVDSFNFTAGQLYSTIGNLSSRFAPEKQVGGKCTANSAAWSMEFFDMFYQIRGNFTCEIYIDKTKIFTSSLSILVEMKERAFWYQSTNLEQIKHQFEPGFWLIDNLQLNDYFSQGVHNLRYYEPFGKYFPTYLKMIQSSTADKGNYTLTSGF